MTLFRALATTGRPRASSSNRSSTFDRALRELAKHARAPTTHDPTRYGLTPSSPPNIHRRTTTIDHDPAPRSHLSIDTSVCNRSPGRRDHAVLLAAPFTSYHFVYMCRVISNTRCTRVLGGPQLPTRTRGGGSPKSLERDSSTQSAASHAQRAISRSILACTAR